MRRRMILASLTSLALVAACSGGETSGGSEGGESPDGGGELTPVRVGSLPIVDTAAIHLGVDQGIFADHGLEVDLQLAQGGAAVVPAVVSGDYQFGFSNVPSLLVASSQGLPLQIVASGNSTSGDPDADIGGVLTSPDSGISAPADLEGRTVAVNTLNNIGDVTISEVVAQDGGDPDAVEFVEMAFPDMPAALSSGQVDAIWVLEPFFSIAKGDGAQVVMHNFAEVDPDMMVAAYFTTGQYAEENPEVVEQFTAAMEESLAYAQDNPEEARAILSSYTEIDPAVTETMTMPQFPAEINADSVQQMADLAIEYGLVEQEVDVEALLP
ncbi:ABC transporter substrate-binding protein [Georgenia alba]|uniref:ABC transporter substrate-binding protein n=1 Tax=Georgenia alba TaxID=2233858 RepID=A0ABW2QB55_9MICO